MLGAELMACSEIESATNSVEDVVKLHRIPASLVRSLEYGSLEMW